VDVIDFDLVLDASYLLLILKEENSGFEELRFEILPLAGL